MNRTLAPKGCVWICSSCHKRSRDIWGRLALDPGWGKACSDHAVLCVMGTGPNWELVYGYLRGIPGGRAANETGKLYGG